MKVYIASPFFNKEQLGFVIEIEDALDEIGVNYFSPRTEGVLINMSEQERKDRMKEIFDSNISHMKECEIVIANIDDRDIGVAFELGFQYAKKKAIFSISNNNYQINVMLKQSIMSHNTNIKGLMDNIKEFINGDELTMHDTITNDVT